MRLVRLLEEGPAVLVETEGVKSGSRSSGSTFRLLMLGKYALGAIRILVGQENGSRGESLGDAGHVYYSIIYQAESNCIELYSL